MQYTVNNAGPNESNDDLDILDWILNLGGSRSLDMHCAGLQRGLHHSLFSDGRQVKRSVLLNEVDAISGAIGRLEESVSFILLDIALMHTLGGCETFAKICKAVMAKSSRPRARIR